MFNPPIWLVDAAVALQFAFAGGGAVFVGRALNLGIAGTVCVMSATFLFCYGLYVGGKMTMITSCFQGL